MPYVGRRAGAGSRRRGTFTVAGTLLACVMLLAGCASMPGRSDISRVDEEPRTDSDSQVRVFGVQPQPNEQPAQIVSGFLEATTSDDPDYQTARKYLAGQAARWDPFTGITVLAGAPKLTLLHTDADRQDTGVSIGMAASRQAVVDAKHSYAPSSGMYRGSFHVSRVDGEWRIDALPDGLVIGESDFDRIYRSVNMYYYARLGPQEDDTPIAKDILVADPVYVRRRIDPLTSSVESLLAGPSTWLDPVVASAFPAGARLAKDAKVALDDSGGLRVPVSGLPRHLDRARCDRMAAQLLDTAQDQSSTQVTSVEMDAADGRSLCTLRPQQARSYAPATVAGSGSEQYFVDSRHRMETVSATGGGSPHTVSGPFGRSDAGLRSVAVSRDERTAAGVKNGGRSLYVAPLSSSGSAKWVLSSKVGLTAPSWDGLGNLWVADQDAAGPGLVMWRQGVTTKVSVPELGDGRIQSVRVAADGVRVALLVRRDGHTMLELGRVERSGSDDHPKVSVTGLRTVAPGLEDVEAASWAGESRLVAVGKWQGVQRLQYVDTDGSETYTPTLPGISEVTAVAAFEDQTRPLLVASHEGMFQLPADADWSELSQKGTAPVYPG